MNKSIKMDLSLNENKYCIDEKKKIECINPHSSSEKRKQTETLIEELDDLDDLFELAMKNRPLFVETLSFIISKMSKHLYTSPYSILFGRIRIHHSTEQNNIDQAFLDGFKI